MNEDIDLEDLEARLYSQVYHGAPEEQLLPPRFEPPPPLFEPPLFEPPPPVFEPPPGVRPFMENLIPPPPPPPRYFIDTNPCTEYIPLTTSNRNEFVKRFQNNPQDLPRRNNFRNWGKETSPQKVRKQRKRKSKTTAIALITIETNKTNNHANKVPRLGEDVVVVSDSDGEESSKKARVVVETETSCKKDEDEEDADDDVIYIEPEPPVVIDLEAEAVDQPVPDKTPTKSPSTSPSKPKETHEDDFLEAPKAPAMRLNPFSFEMQSTEFQNRDFIRPANPTDISYETESSCSTSDLNKDIVSTLQAVVFAEVDFPKDDLFTDNNLEAFKNYITPKRRAETSSKKSDEGSSSESDFEESTPKTLPNLSPMVFQNATPRRSKPKKKKKKSNGPVITDLLKPTEIEEGLILCVNTDMEITLNEAEKEKDAVTSTVEQPQEEIAPQPAEIPETFLNLITQQPEDGNKNKDVAEETHEAEAPQEESINDDLILIEEKPPEIIISDSESDYDFGSMGNVGKDLQLANCSKPELNRTFDKYDIDFIHSNMPDDISHWDILARDLYPVSRFNRGTRCKRCFQFGHLAHNCSKKLNLPKCTLCAEDGHIERSCPNQICTQCGNPGRYQMFCGMCIRLRNKVCVTCSQMGHAATRCPDLWRRYHLTTEEGPLRESQNLPKPIDECWCSGCGFKGHLEYTCNYLNRSYPPTEPFIFCYDNVYPERANNKPVVAPQVVQDQQQPQTSQECPGNTNTSTVPENELYKKETKLKKLKNYSPQYIKSIFMNDSLAKIHSLIARELDALNSAVRYTNIGELRKQLHHFHQIVIKRNGMNDRRVWMFNRKLNMFVFGVQHYKEGRRHCDTLTEFLGMGNTGHLSNSKRATLFAAHQYIFGFDLHTGFDYIRCINAIASRRDNEASV